MFYALKPEVVYHEYITIKSDHVIRLAILYVLNEVEMIHNTKVQYTISVM
jgi:hypothetical protein